MQCDAETFEFTNTAYSIVNLLRCKGTLNLCGCMQNPDGLGVDPHILVY